MVIRTERNGTPEQGTESRTTYSKLARFVSSLAEISALSFISLSQLRNLPRGRLKQSSATVCIHIRLQRIAAYTYDGVARLLT